MVLAAELDPQRHHDAGDVSPAKDRVTAGQGDQLSDRIWLLLGRLAHLAHPVLVHPLEHRQGQVLLVPELVIERSAGIAGLARNSFQVEVAVAVVGEPPRGRLEQGATRTRASIRLPPAATRGTRRRRRDTGVIVTYVHARMLP